MARKKRLLTYREIANLFGVEFSYLSYKCNVSRGTSLAWVIREIISYNWNALTISQRDIVMGIMSHLLDPQMRNSGVLNGLFNDGLLVLPDAVLHRYCLEVFKDSPHNLGV